MESRAVFLLVAHVDPTGCTWKDLGNPGPHHMGISVGLHFLDVNEWEGGYASKYSNSRKWCVQNDYI